VSNYYKSDCCGEQVTLKETIPGIKWNYVCQKCHLPCKVIAVLDTPSGVPKPTHKPFKSTQKRGNLPNPIDCYVEILRIKNLPILPTIWFNKPNKREFEMSKKFNSKHYKAKIIIEKEII